MRVFFYLPVHCLPSAERRAQWTRDHAPPFLQAGKVASAQCWIYQTAVELSDLGLGELVEDLPSEGIIVTLSNLLPTHFQATAGQFVAAIVADFLPHPGAQVQLVQNLAHARRLPNSAFVPHWPQPHLVPRDAARGRVVRTAAFFGDDVNLAPQLNDPDFIERLEKDTGVRLEIRGADRWDDYSDVDVAIAVRGFGRSSFLQKPATKLYNAWLAGVPLIGGRDSAFRAEGRAGRDYLVARSPGEFRRHLRDLQSGPALFEAIVEAGRRHAVTRSREAIRARWRTLLTEDLTKRCRAWETAGPLRRELFWKMNRALLFIDRTARR